MIPRSPRPTYVGQEKRVTADPTQADQELQGDPEIVAPFFIVELMHSRHFPFLVQELHLHTVINNIKKWPRRHAGKCKDAKCLM